MPTVALMRELIDLSLFAGRRRDVQVAPRPLLAAVPQLGTALLVLAVGFAAGIRWPWLLAVGGLLVLVGLVQVARVAVELERRRRTADEWLLWGATARPASALLDWRARELGSARLQKALVHGLRRIVSEGSGKTLPGPVPLNRRAISQNLALVRALSERLEGRSFRPLPIRGVLLVDLLLTEPGSPFYSYAPVEVLAEALGDALAALESERLAVAA